MSRCITKNVTEVGWPFVSQETKEFRITSEWCNSAINILEGWRAQMTKKRGPLAERISVSMSAKSAKADKFSIIGTTARSPTLDVGFLCVTQAADRHGAGTIDDRSGSSAGIMLACRPRKICAQKRKCKKDRERVSRHLSRRDPTTRLSATELPDPLSTPHVGYLLGHHARNPVTRARYSGSNSHCRFALFATFRKSSFLASAISVEASTASAILPQ